MKILQYGLGICNCHLGQKEGSSPYPTNIYPKAIDLVPRASFAFENTHFQKRKRSWRMRLVFTQKQSRDMRTFCCYATLIKCIIKSLLAYMCTFLPQTPNQCFFPYTRLLNNEREDVSNCCLCFRKT